jgi:hypothetical protein
MVDGFRERNFESLNSLLAKNDRLEGSFFETVVIMSKMHSEILSKSSV